MKKLFLLILFCITMLGAVEAADKSPVALFDFTIGQQGWEVRSIEPDADQSISAQEWYHQIANYGGKSAFMRVEGNKNMIKDTWLISPPIDLSIASNCDILFTVNNEYGTSSWNKLDVMVQEDSKIDLNVASFEEFQNQWRLNEDENELPEHRFVDLNHDGADAGALGIGGADKNFYTTNPLNFSMWDGKVVRIAIRMYNTGVSTNNSRSYRLLDVTISGEVTDVTPPVAQITKVDSIGNDFARAWVEADELCQVYWAAMPQGQAPASTQELIDNIGTDSFVSSGQFSYSTIDSEWPFTIEGLDPNFDYTLSYAAVDFQDNATGVQTIDFSSDNDYTAPVIHTLSISEITQISAKATVQSDEGGFLTMRLYEAGLEPANQSQFESASGAIARVNNFRYSDVSEPVDTLLQYLTPDKQYIVYAMMRDISGNLSEMTKSEYFYALSDTEKPVITSASVSDITNYTANLNLVCSEPSAGYDDVTLHWLATGQGQDLTSDEVLQKRFGLASGYAVLDSATKTTVIPLHDLDKNYAYTLHCVAVDGSGNVSDNSQINFSTLDEQDDLLLYHQGFYQEGVGYTTIANVPDGAGARIDYVAEDDDEKTTFIRLNNNKPFITDESSELLVILGPYDLDGVIDAKVEYTIRTNWGNYADRLKVHVSNTYDPNEAFDLSQWTQISQAGETPTPNKEKATYERQLESKFSTQGVYIAFRHYHYRWAQIEEIHDVSIFGKKVGAEIKTPEIEFTLTEATSSITANYLFVGDVAGRVFYYLVEADESATPEEPTMSEMRSGENASVHGYVDYTAGGGRDQNFVIENLKPNTTYHVFSAYKNLQNIWCDYIDYYPADCIFTTPGLEISSIAASDIYATGANLDIAAESDGRIYWTTRMEGEDAPTTFDDIYKTLNNKGNFNYIYDEGQPDVSAYISGLAPETEYTVYLINSEPGLNFQSAIQSYQFTTPKLAVLSAACTPEAVADVYNMNFDVTTTTPGKIHIVMTDNGAAQPSVEDILNGEGGFAGVVVSFSDHNDIKVAIEGLTQAQTENYDAWLVVSSDEYVSEVHQLGVTTDIKPELEKNVKIWSVDGGINIEAVDFIGGKVDIINLTGATVVSTNLKGSPQSVTGLKTGVYIVVIQSGNNQYMEKVMIK